MNIAEALQSAAALGIERLDAQVLLLHVLGRGEQDRAWLIAHDGDALPGTAASAFLALCRRRAAGEPVAYLVGHKEFFGLALSVDARVLVPRPDTETLVTWSLEVLQGRAQPRQRLGRLAAQVDGDEGAQLVEIEGAGHDATPWIFLQVSHGNGG